MYTSRLINNRWCQVIANDRVCKNTGWLMRVATKRKLNCLFMSDEAHFELNDNVNKQNCGVWSGSKPEILPKRELDTIRITVCCAVSSRCIMGPSLNKPDKALLDTVSMQNYVKGEFLWLFVVSTALLLAKIPQLHQRALRAFKFNYL